MHMVDDATTQSTGMFLGRGNDLGSGRPFWALDRALRRAAGLVHGLEERIRATDRMPKERARGEPAVTQFGRMCAKLGIRIIAASSPQGQRTRGRAHGTHQDPAGEEIGAGRDRELRPRPMRIWRSRYLAEHNRRYAHAAAAPADYHRRRPTARQLDEVFWLEEERVVSERIGWCAIHNRLLQLERPKPHWAAAKSRVWVRENEAGEVAIHYRDQRGRLPRTKVFYSAGREKGALPLPRAPFPKPKRNSPPTPHHPWRQGWQQMKTLHFFPEHGETQNRGHFYVQRRGFLLWYDNATIWR